MTQTNPTHNRAGQDAAGHRVHVLLPPALALPRRRPLQRAVRGRKQLHIPIHPSIPDILTDDIHAWPPSQHRYQWRDQLVHWMEGLIEEEDVCVVQKGNSAIDGACVGIYYTYV